MGLPPTDVQLEPALAESPSDSLPLEDRASRRSSAELANDSIFGKLAYHPYFQNSTLAVIVLNAVWIGVDVQANHPVYREQRGGDKLPLEPVSTIIEHGFCTYFSVELIIRFLAYKRKMHCLKDEWFIFDGMLVLFMVIETWVLGIVALIIGGGSAGILSKFSALRLLRLLRLTRMARIMREVPELLTLVKGMISATRAVSFILMFLVLCMYVFAIVFTAQLGDPNAPEYTFPQNYWMSGDDPTAIELFGHIGDSMMTLFTRGMLADNLAETLEAIKDRGGPECDFDHEEAENGRCVRSEGSLMLMWAFVVFMIISAFCLLNMLIGVLCEVIQASAEQENEQAQINDLRAHMAKAFNLIDTSKDGKITAKEWSKMKTQKAVRESIMNLGVEEQHMEESLDQMQESLFGIMDDEDDEEEDGDATGQTGGGGGLTFDQFIEKVIAIRPDSPASALDIEILRVRVEREEKNFNDRLDTIESALTTVNPSSPTADAYPEKPAQAVKGTVLDPKLASSTAWLRDVPTEVLFGVLNSRAPPEVGTSKLLTENLR